LDFLTSDTTENKATVVSVPDDSAPDDSTQTTPPTKILLLNVITDIILNEKDNYPDEIRSNACMFLEKASKAASGSRKYIGYSF
jgi:hypothetical protein